MHPNRLFFKENITMSIGNTIKQLRRGRDLTQEALAEILGVSSKAVSQWENEFSHS